jgi:pimeloyl-ACP methyl ester carboxylesterase
MDIVLVAGLWLPATVWDEVCAELHSGGHTPIAVTLPGVDDGSSVATLDDQVAAVLGAVDSADRPVVVGHSAACTLAWLAADRQPQSISKIVLVGGFPSSDGEKYADFFPSVDGVMRFPGWEPFEGPDAADLDQPLRELIAERSVPVPEGVSKGIVRLSDERRFGIPTALVCPEYSPAQAKAWIDSGDVPELSRVTTLSYADIDSGHWPMVSKPVELARILEAVAAAG